jgi:F420-0:gamma-glutamyl ligase-like protein
MMEMEYLKPNEGKELAVDIDGVGYLRLPVKTHVVTADDNIADVVRKYTSPHLQDGDLIFIAEKIVAITQGRAFPIKDIKPSPLARFLVRFVHKSPYGIGLGSPWTMELAIRETGCARMLFAAAAAAVTKPFGVKGVFYRIAGKTVAAIDGPCDYTIPPFNEYAKLGPKNPDKVALELKREVGYEVVIIDANDLGVSILGKSDKKTPDDFLEKLFRDNPLGQSSQQTPICIVRKA